MVVVVQIIAMWNISIINHDERYQIGVSHGYAEGYNQSIKLIGSHITARDVSSPDRFVTLRTPPGYALIYAAIQSWAIQLAAIDLGLDLVATVIFFIAWFVILEQIGPIIGIWPRIIIWAVWLIFPAGLIASADSGHTTGIVSLALFSLALATGMRVVTGSSRDRHVLSAVYSGIVMGFAALIHYEYWVIAAIIPLTWLCHAVRFSDQKHRFRRAMSACTIYSIITSIFIGLVAINNYALAGRFTRTNPASTDSLNFEHLSYIIPFPNFTIGLSSERFYEPVSRIVFNTDFVIAVFLIALAVWNTWRWLRTENYNSKIRDHAPSQSSLNAYIVSLESARFIFLSGIITIVVVTAFLSWFSINSGIHPYRGGWVQLAELRYFAPVFPFLLLTLVLVFSEQSQIPRRSRVKLFLGIVTGMIMIIGLAPRLVERAENVASFIKTPFKLRQYRDVEILHELASRTSNGDIVLFIEKKQYWLRDASLMAGLPTAMVDWKLGVQTKRPTNIIFYATEIDKPRILDKLQGQKINRIKFRQGYFYQYYLDPTGSSNVLGK